MRYSEGFKWNPKQTEAIAGITGTHPRYVGLYGGSRSGKTLLSCGVIKIRAAKAPESNHLIGRLAFNHAKRSIALGTMPEVNKFVMPNIPMKWYSQDAFFELPNGSRIWIGGYDDKDRIDKILGTEFSTVFNNEASQINYGTIETVRSRLAETVTQVDGRPLRQLEINDLNPTHNRHWSYREFVEGLHPETLEPIDKAKYYALQMNPSDNVENLSTEYLDALQAMSPNKRRRFFDGDYQTDDENAMWQRDWINEHRVQAAPEMRRVVTAVDPSGGGSDDTGIVSVGVAADEAGLDHFYVLSDASRGGSAPKRFEAVIKDHDALDADLIVGESNFGGDIVEKATRDTAELMFHRGGRDSKEIAYKPVVASKGKVLRADPVANVYYQGRVHHVGAFGEMEDEMCRFTSDWNRSKDGSPNRVDALVFAVMELLGAKKAHDGPMGFIV